jgi:hypothetical protein
VFEALLAIACVLIMTLGGYRYPAMPEATSGRLVQV